MEKTNEFNDWLKWIPYTEYHEVKQKIMKECVISIHQFRHWRAGRTKIPALAKEKINKIAGKQVFS